MKHVKFQYGPLTIYGEAWTLEELLAKEKELGADPAELVWQQQHFGRAYKNGITYGWWYSEACIEGEPGSNPVKVLVNISKEQFEHAKAKGWK